MIMGSGSAFEDINNPIPVVRAGDTNSQGVLEISDIIFTTRGPGMLKNALMHFIILTFKII